MATSCQAAGTQIKCADFENLRKFKDSYKGLVNHIQAVWARKLNGNMTILLLPCWFITGFIVNSEVAV
jgi:hypothetical protein